MNATMPKRKPKSDASKDRHKPSRMTRVREALARELDKLVDENASDFTEEVNIAVRERLQRLGRWPVPKLNDCHKDEP